MNIFRTSLAILAALSVGASFQLAAQSSPLKQEVTQLLLMFDKSKCHIQQGDKLLSSLDSKKLFKKQFQTYQQDIHNTEDFIRLATSRHMLTGEQIMLTCNKHTNSLSQDWFSEQLIRYRMTKASKGNMF
ncbi:DUF5329 family protein [Motilimonas cestriensis]|uniref:DUF5329 family protein n=1 Tax=Motilimonas cestriensis TaxID=2742685 RepID=A0ABS8WG43_9GAMM|nr:DUF5329 family protein [Motilimonas cestriensis]MCE2596554.1 DUF5329 family protein [Motilimonas cestriensis]